MLASLPLSYLLPMKLQSGVGGFDTTAPYKGRLHFTGPKQNLNFTAFASQDVVRCVMSTTNHVT